MSDIAKISPAGSWTAATGGMQIPVGCKGIFIKSGGSITITDLDGTALTIAATADAVYPLRPHGVTTASNAYILS
jgi:hypothetical protein